MSFQGGFNTPTLSAQETPPRLPRGPEGLQRGGAPSCVPPACPTLLAPSRCFHPVTPAVTHAIIGDTDTPQCHRHPHRGNLRGRAARLWVLAGPSRFGAPTSLGTRPTSPKGWHRDEGQPVADRGPVTNALRGNVGYEVALLGAIQRRMAKPHSGKKPHPIRHRSALAQLLLPCPRQNLAKKSRWHLDLL